MPIALRWSLLPVALARVVAVAGAAAVGSPVARPFALPAVATQEPAAAQPSDGTIAWERDLAAAEQRARAEQKPLLLVFRCER